MERIFNVNDELVCSIEDVVDGMYKATNECGELFATVIEDPGYVKINGYYECDMEIDVWRKEHKNNVKDIEKIIEELKNYKGDEYVEEPDLLEDAVQNCFLGCLKNRLCRLHELFGIGAPEIVIQREIIAFSYYWILNRYCVTL